MNGTKSVQTTTHGLTTSSRTKDTTGAVITGTDHTYDAHQRPLTVTDLRTGATTYSGHTEAGQPLTVTDPGGRVTATENDIMGRPVKTTLPDTTARHTAYHPTGQVKAIWGSQTNPTWNVYDEQGRRIELHTWKTDPAINPASVPATPPSGSEVTTWIYGSSTGHLDRKQYADGKGTDYTYTAAGRIATRTWARSSVATPKVTTYTYTHGFLTTTDYSDTTPDVHITYDALGRKASESSLVSSVSQSSVSYTYDPATLAIDTETVSYDLNLDTTPDLVRVIDRSQDSLLRDTGWQLKDGSTVENQTAYTYGSTDGRLTSISNPQLSNVSFAYGYVSGSSLIGTVTGPAHTVTNTWEATRNTLASKENEVGSTLISGYSYTVNSIGQRTNVAKTGSAFGSARDIAWGYDALGQVISADSTIPGLDRGYRYDMIGNRLKSADGTTDPDDPSATGYAANALNQYSAIGTLAPSYDDDGNMTSGPLPTNVNANSTLVWDGENRLIEAQVTGGGTVTYLYDAQSRRIAETVGSATKVTIYDGWNPIAEYGASYALTKTYTWGMDLSGTMQGAGGVGGLLSVTDGTGIHFPTYDGNGNVSEYLDGTGTVVAHYEYDPFGKTTVATGSKANDFAHRFSTKALDETTGLYYYGYRFYDPVTGRWPSRDPIQERGGVNLYAFVGNNSLSRVDRLGLFVSVCTPWPGESEVVDKFIRWDVGSWIDISGEITDFLGMIDLPDLGMNIKILEQHRIKIVERTEYWISKEFCCECDGADYFTPPSISCGVREKSRSIVKGPTIIRDLGSTQVRTKFAAAGSGSYTTDWEDKFK